MVSIGRVARLLLVQVYTSTLHTPRLGAYSDIVCMYVHTYSAVG